MNKEELINLIDSLKISKENFVVLPSGSLVLREIYDIANDLDIAVTKQGLQQLKENYDLKQKDNGWYIVTDKVECVLDDMIGKKEKVGCIYVQEINDYLAYLEQSSREKDKLRISLVKEYIKNCKQ